MIAPVLQDVRDAYRGREHAHDEFVRALVAARKAGYGYGAIAAALEVPRTTLQSMVNRYQEKETE